MSLKGKVFTQKTYGAQLYKWAPSPNTITKRNGSIKPFYCNAFPNTQGQDWVTTYSYNIVVVDGQQGRIAYVECDYVE